MRIVWLFTVLAPVIASAQAVAPGVSWEDEVIRASGSGPPDMKAVNPAQARLGAETAAQADAFKNLMAQVQALPIAADRTVGDEIKKDEATRAKLEALVRDFKIVRKRYFSDSGLEIDVEVPLAPVAHVVLPAPSADAPAAAAAATEGAKRITGVVVDARRVKGFEPVLAPRLVDDAGNVLHAAEHLTDEARAANGVAAWAKSVEQAKKKRARVGARPLIVKAQKANGSDLVLSAAEAKKLAKVDGAVLRDGRVVIVTRPAASKRE